jgi:hypothetical protein
MADLSSPSFIPKQNPTKTTRRTASRQVYLLTIVSYLLIIAALIAVVSLFLYDKFTLRKVGEAIEAYDRAIASFNVDDMHEVIELNERLSAADKLLDGNVSLRAALAIIEDTTIDTVQFSDLVFTRTPENDIALEAMITTDSFDSVLFQRDMYEEAEKIATVELKDVAITFATTDVDTSGAETTKVGFSALFSVNPDTVPYIPEGGTSRLEAATSSVSTSTPSIETATTTASSSSS